MTAVYQQQDSEIVARVGETFVVELEGNPTTGYAWELAEDDARFRLVKKDYAHPGAGIGAATKERFHIEALQPGSTTLSFKYKQPWETEVLDTKSFRLVVQPG
jgi:inhibitor of cysteine peptidase